MPKRHPTSPVPPAPRDGRRATLSGGASFGGYKLHTPEQTQEHAEEVKAVARGQDVVEGVTSHESEKRPAAFDRRELGVVRSWVKSRPLEGTANAAAEIPYPRMWNTKRGRYSKFSLPGSGSYGILRARPTF